jgi:ribosomal protein S18 acetylase RimI-like enzyme
MLLHTAEPADAEAVAAVHVRSWKVAYRGLLPDEYLDRLRPQDRAPHYTFGDRGPHRPLTTVATEHGEICGFATTGPSRDADRVGSGELYALYVDPASWNLGVGRALMSDARERLANAGFADAYLWVLEGNTRAERFYRLAGWTPEGSRRPEEHWGVVVQETCYRTALP